MPGRKFNRRSLPYNAKWRAYKCKIREQEGAGAPVMEEIPLAFLQAEHPTLTQLDQVAEEATDWVVELEMEEESSSQGMSFWSRLKQLLSAASRCFRLTSNHRRGLCPSCSGLLRATRESNGCVPTFPGDPHVEPIQTELFLMESLTTTPRKSTPESWSPRSPRAMTIRFGNRLGLLRLSYPRTCSCPESGTHLTPDQTTPLINKWGSSTSEYRTT